MAGARTTPTRRLGTEGPEISRLGLGAWAMGGHDWTHGWGAQDDDLSVATIRRAVDRGVSWIDTAPVYGLGRAEEVVGRALQAIAESDRPLVFTKCGLRWDPDDRGREPWHDLSQSSIRAECEDSLRRLGVERLDVLFIHWPDPEDPRVSEAWATVAGLVNEGKVGLPGVSNFSVEQLDECQAVHPVGVVQPRFNLLDRDRGADVIPWATAHGAGVVVHSPMASGLLTDHFDHDRLALLPADDWRRSAPAFQEPALSHALTLRDALRPVAERHGASVREVAIAWTLAQPGVTGAIVGARSPEQVDGWASAAGLALAGEDLADISGAIVRSQSHVSAARGSGHVTSARHRGG